MTLSLNKRILAGYLVPLTLMLAVAGVVYWNARSVKFASADLQRMNGLMRDLNKLDAALQKYLKGTRGFMLLTAEEARTYERGRTNLKDAKTAFDEALQNIDASVVDAQQREAMRNITTLTSQLNAITDKELDLVAKGKMSEAVAFYRSDGAERDVSNQLNAALRAFEKREQELLTAASDHANLSLDRLVLAVFGATFIAILAAIAFAMIIARRITHSIGEAVIGVSSSSSEIAATVNEHERAVSQQAAAVNETTSTVEELGASSRQSASQAEATAEAARQALGVTQNGIALASQVSDSMTALKHKVSSVAEQILRLSEQAQQIGSIAKVIGELASETNMLALNAAVEAARAGEHGKGFAVVAAEVRKLADQSKKSGERANALVAEIQKATNSAVMVTDEGTRTAEEVTVITEKTLEAFSALASTATGVSESAQQVLLNSKQQAAALSQVTEAMKSLSTGSREMAAGTAQTKIGVEKLNLVALELKAMI